MSGSTFGRYKLPTRTLVKVTGPDPELMNTSKQQQQKNSSGNYKIVNRYSSQAKYSERCYRFRQCGVRVRTSVCVCVRVCECVCERVLVERDPSPHRRKFSLSLSLSLSHTLTHTPA